MRNKMIKISTKISTAMVVAASVMTMASITAFAAPADEVSLHTTQMTFEITEDEESHEITDAQRQQLHENLAKDAKERNGNNDINWKGAKEVVEGIMELYDTISDLFG